MRSGAGAEAQVVPYPRVRTGRLVARLTPFKRMELGLRSATRYMYQQDRIWARYSNDKVDVGDTLITTLRTLSKALPLETRKK